MKQTIIDLATLEVLASKKGIKVDAMRKLAESQGYTVVETMEIDIAAELAAMVDPVQDEATDDEAIDNTSVWSDFADGMNNQALYNALINLTKGTLYAIAKNTDEKFAPTALYEREQYTRMREDASGKWHLVIMASERILKSLKVGKDDSDNKARLIGGMIAYFNDNVALQDTAKAEKEAVARKTTRKAAKGTQKVNKVSGEKYVEAPSQAKKNERKNAVKNDADAQAQARYDELNAYVTGHDFSEFPFVETCLRGHLRNYALKVGAELSPYQVAWNNAVNANDYRKAAMKYARKGKVEKMAQMIVDNRANFKGLAFVHKSGIKVTGKAYREFGDINPLYADMADYVEFLQEATQRANELQKA